MAADFVGAVPGRRRKSASERRNQALLALRLVASDMLKLWELRWLIVATSSIGSLVPVLSSFAPVVPQAGLVSRGSVVDDGVPSLLLPCVHGTVP